MIKHDDITIWTLFVDGASRNNPGPSGAGIYLEKNGTVFIKDGYYLGIKTNNQAEYLALIFGLFIVAEQSKKGDTIEIVSDSQLLVRQLIGLYKVRDAQLQRLHAICKEKMHGFDVTIKHVLRAYNTEADAMANQGVEDKKYPPKQYIALLKSYGVIL